MKCKCNDVRHDTTRETAWHRAWCNWYDAREAGHRARAAVWGRVADILCN